MQVPSWASESRYNWVHYYFDYKITYYFKIVCDTQYLWYTNSLPYLYVPYLVYLTTNSTTRGHSAKITKAHGELDIRRIFIFRKSYQHMEPTGPRSCWLRHCKFFQEQPRANQEIKDRLLHGWSGPLSLMATSDCSNQVRPHLVSYLVSIYWIKFAHTSIRTIGIICLLLTFSIRDINRKLYIFNPRFAFQCRLQHKVFPVSCGHFLRF